VGRAALCQAICADPGLALGDIMVLANLLVRAPDEFQRLPGLKLYAAMSGLRFIGSAAGGNFEMVPSLPWQAL